MEHKTFQGAVFAANVISKRKLNNMKIKLKNIYKFECYDKKGNLKWVDFIENLVVNAGLDDALSKYFKGSNYTAAHYLGLTSGTPTPDPDDVMDSHSGWTEVTAYDEANRPTITWGSVSGQSVDNSANRAVFTISSNSTTIGGGFITTNNTKGGTTGILYGIGAFSAGNKVLDDDDTLSVAVTAVSAAS